MEITPFNDTKLLNQIKKLKRENEKLKIMIKELEKELSEVRGCYDPQEKIVFWGNKKSPSE